MLWLALALIGAVPPYSQFLPWLAEHGPNLPLLFTELFSTRIAAFFGLDVLVSAVVLIAFIRREVQGVKWTCCGYRSLRRA